MLLSIYGLTIGAAEPFSFLYFLAFSYAGVGYSVAITFKNIIFVLVVCSLGRKIFGKSFGFVVFVIFLATDYYVFRLMSELHRCILA